MAPSDLDEALRKRGRETAEGIMRAARTAADRIAADADQRIEERRSAVLSSRKDEYRTQARTDIAAERHEAMRAVLLAKTRVVERVLERARTLLPAELRNEAYQAALEEEVEEALAFVGSEEAAVLCSETLAPAVRQALRATPEVSVQVRNDAGSGFVVVGQAGRVRVDSTLETRLDRLAPTLAIEIHERLEER